MRIPPPLKRLARPAYTKVRSATLARVEPYVYIEAHAERMFWKYLGGTLGAVQSIVIVGAWQGSEIPDLVNRYRDATIVAFEPSPANFKALTEAYAGNRRVRCYETAISDSPGEATFHEGSLPGSGSLLGFGAGADATSHNVGLYEKSKFVVAVSTLDGHEATRDLERVDLLKIDVQGAEARVLRGGARLISRTSAVLVEVALRGSAYSEATAFHDVDEILRGEGLMLVGLGVDPITLDGNALYVRVG